MTPGTKGMQIQIPGWLYDKLRALADYNGVTPEIAVRLLLGPALGGGSSGLEKPPSPKKKTAAESPSVSGPSSGQPETATPA